MKKGFSLLLLVVLVSIWTSCKKDDDDSGNINTDNYYFDANLNGTNYHYNSQLLQSGHANYAHFGGYVPMVGLGTSGAFVQVNDSIIPSLAEIQSVIGDTLHMDDHGSKPYATIKFYSKDDGIDYSTVIDDVANGWVVLSEVTFLSRDTSLFGRIFMMLEVHFLQKLEKNMKVQFWELLPGRFI